MQSQALATTYAVGLGLQRQLYYALANMQHAHSKDTVVSVIFGGDRTLYDSPMGCFEELFSSDTRAPIAEVDGLAARLLEVQLTTLAHSDHPANGDFQRLVFAADEFEQAVDRAVEQRRQADELNAHAQQSAFAGPSRSSHVAAVPAGVAVTTPAPHPPSRLATPLPPSEVPGAPTEGDVAME